MGEQGVNISICMVFVSNLMVNKKNPGSSLVEGGRKKKLRDVGNRKGVKEEKKDKQKEVKKY